MRTLSIMLGFFVVAGCLGSGGSGDGSGAGGDRTKAAANALTAAVGFDEGTVISGALPSSTASGVTLQALQQTVIVSPGISSIMAIEVDNPDEGTDPIVSTLVHFERGDDHIEVTARDKSFATVDGSGGGGAAEPTRALIDNSFTVSSSVCDGLCAEVTTLTVTEVAVLASGAVGAQNTRELQLDCSEAGSQSACGSSSGSETSGETGGVTARDDGLCGEICQNIIDGGCEAFQDGDEYAKCLVECGEEVAGVDSDCCLQTDFTEICATVDGSTPSSDFSRCSFNCGG